MNSEQASMWLDESWKEYITQEANAYLETLARLEREERMRQLAQSMVARHRGTDLLYSWQKPQELIPLEP